MLRYLALIALILLPALALAEEEIRFPQAPPPLLEPGPDLPGPAVEVPLQAGWNVFSVPLASVEGVSGFPRAWLDLVDGRWVTRVPGRDLLDPGRGYLTYADEAVVARVAGPPGPPESTRLAQGWNLLGCPSKQPIPVAALGLQGLAPEGHDLKTSETVPLAGSTLQPGRALAVYAQQPLEVAWASPVDPRSMARGTAPPLPPAETPAPQPPASSSVNPRASAYGETPAPAPAPAPARTAAPAPASAAPAPSALRLPFPLPVPGSEDGTGTLEGQVRDRQGNGLNGARVRVEGGRSTFTDRNGYFSIENLPAGRLDVQITLSGYRAGSGTVTILDGETRNLLVSLSRAEGAASTGSSGTRPAEPVRTTLTVRAHPYRTDGKKYSVKMIEVWDSEKYWKNTFYRSYDSYVELRCEGAVVGRNYKVAITWRHWRDGHEMRSMWEPKVYKEYQTESYYNP